MKMLNDCYRLKYVKCKKHPELLNKTQKINLYIKFVAFKQFNTTLSSQDPIFQQFSYADRVMAFSSFSELCFVLN